MDDPSHHRWRGALNQMRALGFYKIARKQGISVELNDVQIWSANLPDSEVAARLDAVKQLEKEQFSARGIASFFGVDTVLTNFGLWQKK